MPQTESVDGHAHLHEDGGTRTTVTDGHWHRIRHGEPLTGLSVSVGSLKEIPESEGGHRHPVKS